MVIRSLIKGIHHVTATVNDAQEDFDFYTKVLGQRLVKKTVNFDNNQVYHFYYGDRLGTPGTLMTTFPYKGWGMRKGKIGTGQVSVTGFSVPETAIDFWKDRLNATGREVSASEKFGHPVLSFRDPSGLALEITGNKDDRRQPWTTAEISAHRAIRGFYNVTLSIADTKPDFDFLTGVFGFQKQTVEGKLTRMAVDGGGPGKYLDISDDQGQPTGRGGIGTVHHVAWRIENDEDQLMLRQHLMTLGFKVTEVQDRNYFKSIYFRIPGRVLFEVATIPPGFTVDESEERLGGELKLPVWEEPNRAQIESVLPNLKA